MWNPTLNFFSPFPSLVCVVFIWLTCCERIIDFIITCDNQNLETGQLSIIHRLIATRLICRIQMISYQHCWRIHARNDIVVKQSTYMLKYKLDLWTYKKSRAKIDLKLFTYSIIDLKFRYSLLYLNKGMWKSVINVYIGQGSLPHSMCTSLCLLVWHWWKV